jgi:hypothetical protein
MRRHAGATGLFGGVKGFGLGIAASLLIDAVAPELGKSVAPATRSALKFLFRMSDQVARSTARTREQLEDFVASTRAEYEAEQGAVAPTDGSHAVEPEA